MVLQSVCLALSILHLANSPVPVADPVFVPAKMLGQYFAVEGVVNGKPAKFIVDTGAGMCVLTPEAAKKFGVPEGQAIMANGAGEKPVQAHMTMAQSFGMGTAMLSNVRLVTIDLPPALQVDGLVGYTFLQRYAVTLDYQKPGLTLYDAGVYAPKPGVQANEMKVRGSIPTFPGAIDGISGWYSLDSGANATLTLMGPFVEANKLKEKHPNRQARIVGKGVGGFVFGESVRLDDVEFAGVKLPPMPASFSTTKSGALANSELIGNVGGEALRRFITTIDYPGGKIYFEKNSAFGDPFSTDRSGMFVDFVDHNATVVDVVPHGPADDAGLKVGDIILTVNGTSMSTIHPLETGKIMKASVGTKVKLKVKRVSEEIEITLVLRDIL